jgi:hypothetical protein
MTAIEFLDRPPAGWFTLEIFREGERRWLALMIDVHPDDLKNCLCDFPALLFVSPDDYRPGHRTARQTWVRVPGKHRSRDAAWDALEEMMATRH